MTKPTPPPALNDLPGHGIRRLQQIAVGIFLDETADANITPVQFSLLLATQQQLGLDQRTAAATIGFDTSTIGAVIDRLEARGLIRRNASPTDRRVRLLTITPQGDALLAQVVPAMWRAQQRILAPLPPQDQPRFMAMVWAIVDANAAWSRAAKEPG